MFGGGIYETLPVLLVLGERIYETLPVLLSLLSKVTASAKQRRRWCSDPYRQPSRLLLALWRLTPPPLKCTLGT